MNPIKKLAGQTAIYGLPSILGRILNYLLVPLHTYLFSTTDYGIQNFFYALTAFFAVIFTYGMETAYFRYVSLSDNKHKTYSTTQISLFLTTLPILTSLILFAPQIASLLGYASQKNVLIWFALILSFDALCAIPFARLRIENKAITFALVKFINIVTNIAFNLFFLLLMPYLFTHYSDHFSIIRTIYNPSWTIEYVFLSNLFASAVTFLILSRYTFDFKGGFDRIEWKKMLRYALPLLFFGMAGIINETFDRILLKWLLPSDIAESELGIYGACYKISILMTIFIQAYRYAAEPFFFLQAKEKNATQTFADLMKYFIIAACLIFIITMLFLDVALLFIGKDFREGREVVPILMLANLFLGVFYNLSIWFKLTNKTQWGAYIALFGAVITLGLNFCLIPILGYVGSAWATFACYGMMMLISYIVGTKFYPIPYPLKRIGLYFGLALSIYFLDYFITIPIAYISVLWKIGLILLFVLIAFRLDIVPFLKKKRS